MNITTIDDIVQRALIDHLFSACAIGVVCRSRGVEFSRFYGAHTFTPWSRRVDDQSIFDLASLTKPLGTALAICWLRDRAMLDISQPLGAFFNGVTGCMSRVTLAELLTHTSGLPAWMPLYRFKGEDSRASGSADPQWIRYILSLPLHYTPGTRSVYSDLGFILLGAIVEKVSQQGFMSFLKKRIFYPVGASGMVDGPGPGHDKPLFVPTGFCYVRKRLCWGMVNDLNCWSMGGVCGHAGLFAPLGDVMRLVTAILDTWTGDSGSFGDISRKGLVEFLEYRGRAGEFALGFDRPSGENSTSGRFFSTKSVGHLGYTGTSFWIDPEARLAVVILTNRTFPLDVSGERVEMNRFRQRVHDSVRIALDLAWD